MTPPYTPQRNGISERINQTLLNKVRCMIEETNLNKRFWGEAVTTATNLKNKSPTKALPSGKTPYEVFWNEVPNYDKLRVFGSKIMIKNNKKIKKLENRAREGIYLDYDDKNNLYKVFINDTNRVELSRDITFTVKEPRDLSKILIPDPETTKLLDKENKIIEDSDDSDEEIINEKESQESEESESSQSEISYDEDEALFPRENRYDNNTTHNNDEEMNDEESSEEEEIRKSTRERKKVIHKDFKMYNIETDPLTYKEAIESERKEEWIRAMETEKKSLNEMNTWIMVEKPPDKPTVEAKWIFVTKTNPDGSKKSKARLVAKGFTQVKFINYDETFAPVIRKEHVRYLLSQAVAYELEVHHMDVDSAFLNGELKEEIYMVLPQGFGEHSGKIVKLLKSLYGLKQSSNCWYEKINNTLKSNNYYPSSSDPCVYINKNNEGKVKGIIGLYVDDNIILGKKDEVKKMKELLSKYFKMKDLGEVKLILGMEIERDKKGIRIYQRDYIRKILDKFGMSECKKVDTPFEESKESQKFKNLKNKNNLSPYPTNINTKNNSDFDNKPFENRELYYQAVGCLNYLACTSRPDIAFATNLIARAMSDPRQKNWTQVKRLFRYLKGTIDYSLNYSNDTTNIDYRKIVGYSDSSFAPPTDPKRKSIGAYIFTYNGGAISWSSKRQTVVALSSCEAEYIALTEAGRESQWLVKLHQEINQTREPILIFEDNTSAIKVSGNNSFSDRTKHIDIRFHYIRELIEEKKVIVRHCPTDQMPADALTKGLNKIKFALFRSMMGILKI